MPRKQPTPESEGGDLKLLPERPPRGLGRHGRQFWRDFVTLANRLGASAADEPAFLECAQHYQFAMLAWETIEADGLFRLDENGVTRRHPAAQVHRDSWAAVLKTLALFGMTPASRKFQTIGHALDPFEQYLLDGMSIRNALMADVDDAAKRSK